jgi:hypothetical protein
MNNTHPRIHEAVLVILRNTLHKLEFNPASEIDAPAQAEFKRILRVRIANLEAESAAICRLLSIRGNHGSQTRR